MPDPLVWIEGAGQYRDPATGRFISRPAIRQALEQSLANLTKHTDTLADDLRAGRISLTEWQAEMRDTIKQVHMAAEEVAQGGRDQMTPTDYGRVGQRVRVQYQYLDNWTQQIKDGLNVSEGRAKQYLASSRTAYLEAEASAMRERGYLARSVLRPAEHCAECIAEADKGLVEVQFLVPVGQRTCRGNCRCFLVYERAA